MFCSLLARCRIPCACHAEQHSNVQKCSEPLSFFHFWLRNVLRATTACAFPKVLRTRQFVTLLTSKCALRHNGVHFSTYFDSEMCFAPQSASLIWPDVSAPAALASLLFFSTLRSHKSLEKHSESWLFYRFARSTMHLRRNSADLLRRNCSPTFLPITCAETSVKPYELPANYVQSGPKNDTMGHLTIDLPNSSSL